MSKHSIRSLSGVLSSSQRPRRHISCVQVSSGWNLRGTYPRVLFFFFLVIGPSSVPPGLGIWGRTTFLEHMPGNALLKSVIKISLLQYK